MPNWCRNTLVVEGDEISLKLFVEKVGQTGKILSFAIHIVPPTEAEFAAEEAARGGGGGGDGEKKFSFPSWYAWNVANWGTKWDCKDASIVCETSGMVTFIFDTAWSPPNPWLAAVALMEPTLRFTMTFEDEGCEFAGTLFAQGNRVYFSDFELPDWRERDEEDDSIEVIAPQVDWPRHQICRHAALFVASKFGQILHVNDVVLLLAKYVWATRDAVEWDDCDGYINPPSWSSATDYLIDKRL